MQLSDLKEDSYSFRGQNVILIAWHNLQKLIFDKKFKQVRDTFYIINYTQNVVLTVANLTTNVSELLH